MRCFIKKHSMKTYWGVVLSLYAFLTSALDECEWSASRSGRSNPWEKSRHTLDRRLGGIQGWSGPRSKDKISLSCSWRKSNIGHPAGSLVTTLTELLRLSTDNLCAVWLRRYRRSKAECTCGKYSWSYCTVIGTEPAFRHRGCLQMCEISSCGHPTRGSPSLPLGW
jgi:hypothetical protein